MCGDMKAKAERATMRRRGKSGRWPELGSRRDSAGGSGGKHLRAERMDKGKLSPSRPGPA